MRFSFALTREAGGELQPPHLRSIRPIDRRPLMRFGDERESSNFTDDTGRGGFGLGGGGLGGGGLGCLIPLIASRFGIGGVVVLLVGYFLLSSLGGLGGSGGVAPSSQQVSAPTGRGNLDPATT